jgi:hypothetical protein
MPIIVWLSVPLEFGRESFNRWCARARTYACGLRAAAAARTAAHRTARLRRRRDGSVLPRRGRHGVKAGRATELPAILAL